MPQSNVFSSLGPCARDGFAAPARARPTTSGAAPARAHLKQQNVTELPDVIRESVEFHYFVHILQSFHIYAVHMQWVCFKEI